MGGGDEGRGRWDRRACVHASSTPPVSGDVMTPRSGSSRIASGFSGRAAGAPDPRSIDGDPREAHVVRGPTRRELGAAAAGGKIANQPVRGSWGVMPAWMPSAAAVSRAAASPTEEFAGAGVETNEACRVQWQRTLLTEARRGRGRGHWQRG
jgi:hypothetical protein